MSQIHYLPLTPGFFAILVGIFVIVLILRSVRYAYESLGVSSGAAMFLLFATLVGSILNIPVAELPPERIVSHEVIHFFGMRYRVPVVTHWARTVIAVQCRRRGDPDLTRACNWGRRPVRSRLPTWHAVRVLSAPPRSHALPEIS
jgi:hypothetical protein